MERRRSKSQVWDSKEVRNFRYAVYRFCLTDLFNVFINVFPRIVRSIDAYPLEKNKGSKGKKFIKI